MTEHDNATDDAHSSNERAFARYGSFTADGDVLVFDRENHERWVQSDAAVELSEVR